MALNISPERGIPRLAMYAISTAKVELINLKPEIHNLTHRKLLIKYWKIQMDDLIPNPTPIKNLVNYPFPIVLSRFIKSYF